MKGTSGDEELIMSLRGLIIFYAPSPVVIGGECGVPGATYDFGNLGHYLHLQRFEFRGPCAKGS